MGKRPKQMFMKEDKLMAHEKMFNMISNYTCENWNHNEMPVYAC